MRSSYFDFLWTRNQTPSDADLMSYTEANFEQKAWTLGIQPCCGKHLQETGERSPVQTLWQAH